MAQRDNLIYEIANLRKNISSRLEKIDAGELTDVKEIMLTSHMIDDFTEK